MALQPSDNPSTTTNGNAGPVNIEHFTDPLCCWSWALRPHLERLLKTYPQHLNLQYRMAGLVPAWQNYHDVVNDISRPTQMGPLWMEVKHLAQVPMEEKIWFFDPPASSYPACIAVKSAGLQSPEAGAALFCALQKAVMTDLRNVAKWPVIKAIAQELEQEMPEKFSAAQFTLDLKGPAKAVFAQDLERKKLANVTRTPSLIITQKGKRGIIITGYRPYEELLRAIKQVCPLTE